MRAFLIIAALTNCGLLAQAGPNLIMDGDFENPPMAGDWAGASVQLFYSGSVIGGAWNVTGAPDRNVIAVHQNFDLFADSVSHSFGNAQSGKQYMDLSGAYFLGDAATLSQEFTTVPGQRYSLSFYLGASDGYNGVAGSEHAPLKSVNIRIDQPSGPNLLNELLTPPAPQQGTIQWAQYDFTFEATSSQTRLSFQGLSGFDDNTSFVDTISVNSVPEAMPKSLGATSIAALLLVRAFGVSRRVRTVQLF